MVGTAQARLCPPYSSVGSSRFEFQAAEQIRLRDPAARCARRIPSFRKTKERSDKTLWTRLNPAAGVMVYECRALMFLFTQKKFVGSYLLFKAPRRSSCAPSVALILLS